MASGVSLGDGVVWWVPGVHADRLFGAARQRVRPDSPLGAELAMAVGAGPLQLEVLPPQMAAEMRRLLVDTASAQVAALDPAAGVGEWDIGYRNSLGALLALLASPRPVAPASSPAPADDRMANPAAASLIARLVQGGPGMDEGLRLHMDTFGGLYPRTLLRAVAYVALDLSRSSDPRERLQAVGLVRFLEHECGVDPEVDAAITAFVRSLAGADRAGVLVNQLGPTLRRLLEYRLLE